MRGRDTHLSLPEIDAIVQLRRHSLGNGNASESDFAEALQHLDSCGACRATLDMHLREQDRLSRLRAIGQAARGPQCPPESALSRLAAGLTEASEARAQLIHAAGCDYCGPRLRAITADFAAELTPEEELALGNLASEGSGWQRRLASRMCESRPRWSVPEWLRVQIPFGRVPAAAYIGALVVLTVAALFTVRLARQTPVETLIATAYTQERTFELRIPDAAHAGVRRTRGSAAGSRLDRPPALLESEARIARELQQGPPTADLLQAAGRCELLDWHYQAAMQNFQQALQLGPESPSLIIDLASAYFESAEANQHRRSDYAAAADLLDRVLRSSPGDPVALFNRAIVYGRMGEGDKAIADWNSYLKVDRDSAWASEAKQRLTATQSR